MTYEELLAQLRGDGGRTRPRHPGPGATPEAIEAYHEQLADYEFNSQAESLQRITAVEAEAKRAAERERELSLSLRGSITGSGHYTSSILLRSPPIQQFVRWMDAEADEDSASDTFSVCIARGDRGVFGINLMERSPTAPYVVVSRVNATTTFADPTRHVLASHALHTPLDTALPTHRNTDGGINSVAGIASQETSARLVSRGHPIPQAASRSQNSRAPAMPVPTAAAAAATGVGGVRGRPANILTFFNRPSGVTAGQQPAASAATPSNIPREQPSSVSTVYSIPRLEEGDHILAVESISLSNLGLATLHDNTAVSLAWLVALEACRRHTGKLLLLRVRRRKQSSVSSDLAALHASRAKRQRTELLVASASAGASPARAPAAAAVTSTVPTTAMQGIVNPVARPGSPPAHAGTSSTLVASPPSGTTSAASPPCTSPPPSRLLTAITMSANDSQRFDAFPGLPPPPLRPLWSHHAPVLPLRHEVMRLLRAEKNALRYFRHAAEQWLTNRLVPRIAAALAAAEEASIDAAVAMIARSALAAAATPSVRGFEFPGASLTGHVDVVAMMAAEATAFEQGMALRPSQAGGIVDMLLDGYVPTVHSSTNDSDDEVVIVEDDVTSSQGHVIELPR